MSPETRSRTIDTLLGAALPVLAFTQLAFYSWAGARSLDIATFRNVGWWVGGLALFVGILIAAGFIATAKMQSPRSSQGAVARERRRGLGPVARIRVVWALLVGALVAYVFYRTAFSSWFASLPFLISFRFLSFQDWRWWFGGFIAFFGFLIAAAVVMARDPKSRSLPATPIADPSHELRLDGRGNELASGRDTDRGTALHPIAVRQEPSGTAIEPLPLGYGRVPPSYSNAMRWLRFGMLGLTALLLVHYWAIREITINFLGVALLMYALGVVAWRALRAR